ncbi:MAG TPA: CARDB domain-containing protein, partial [Bacteroidia bacterium]
VTPGSSINAYCYVYNQGSTLSSSSNVGYYLSTDANWDASDVYLGYYSGASLAASSSSYRSLSLTIPSTTAPGNYYILFYADYSGAVAESNETNNVSSSSITIQAPVIDLYIQSQSISPTTVAAGYSITASCYINNQGNATASSSNVGFYLSTDAVWDAGDTYLNYSAGGTLSANSSSYRSVTVGIPSGTTPGTYYILFYADYSNAVSESVETNNVVALAINVITPFTDLVIQNPSVSSVTIASGNSINATCYIYNQGNVTVNTSNVGYYLSTDAVWDASDVYLNFSSGSTLGAGSSSYRSVSVTIPSGTTTGSYYILFYADYSNVVAEDVETNNVSYVPITVAAPTVDLIIQGQTANPLTLSAGNSTSASCTIFNQGNSLASSSNVGFYLSTDATWDVGDTYLNYSPGASLNGGTSSARSVSLTIPSTAAPGNYYLLYYADYSNAVSENVETNNVAAVPITVQAPSIDLIIQNQSISPTTVVAGNSLSAYCYIYNQGNTLSNSSNVGYYLSTDAVWDASDVYLAYSAGSSLAAASNSYRSVSLTIPSGTAAGTYYILFYADYSNVVSETDETNNVASSLVTVVAPGVDLIIQSPTASPTTITAGNSTSVSCYMYNQGNVTSTTANVGYYLSTNTTWDASDVYLNYSTGTSLAASSSYYVSSVLAIPSGTAPGNYYILYYADYSN